MNSNTQYHNTWTNIHNLLFTLFFVAYMMGMHDLMALVFTGMISFIVLWLIHFNFLKTFKPFAGYANWITLLRLVIILFVGFQHDKITDLKLLLLVIGAISLDGLDGFIARKMKQTSSFGTQFDMETDAFYVALMSVIIVHKGYVGLWLLPVGFMRYLYGTLVYVLRIYPKDHIRTRFAATIAGIFFVALPTPLFLPGSVYRPVLIIASGLVILSFGYSFWMLIKDVQKQNDSP